MKFTVRKMLIASAALALLLAGCGADKEGGAAASVTTPAADAKLKVVATFYPMAEFSRQVAGDYAEVISLVPSGVEPHDWEPSAKDMTKIKEADVFVYNGIVEEWVEDALNSAASEKRIVVEASSGIELIEGTAEEHDEGESGQDEHEHASDPHVWLSPVLAQQEVRAIEAALAQADPKHMDDYAKNADAYIAKLKELDQAYTAGLQNVARREFVTQHAAFSYLAKQYGLTQVPISGLSPDQEPSPDDMAKIINFAKEKQVKTIFFETLADEKVAKIIAEELGAKTDVLNPLEGLTDEDRKNNLDYIGIMKNNLAALQKALNE